ncbi:glutaredoxin family protein [Vibrio vulnificus]|uniref:glutaredoxin family protein n=1 Tax=Vibrio vulnificus TaxID=672 RepID=UPI000CD09D12|nr:glutaredoxin family protein [Vibrio vulnificus]EIT7144573.1 glutaredoxin family protein [Vibrio vulnificus]EIZ1362542.1 glutaredoxin family protein [Vibrio vulnificus]POB85055.1 NrdH-redoxin [Vibrio vulnificus]
MITLYGTEGCHLCEMAYELVEQAGIAEQVQVIDIAFDDALFSRYGVTIPVLNSLGSELGWPFDLEKLKQWLDDNGITYHS